jgi:O-antigen ligase
LYSGHHAILSKGVVTAGSLRLNSTFDEVSALSPHMAVGLAIAGWDLCTKPLRWGTVFKFIAMLGAVLCSESTTGYVTLILLFLSLGALSVHGYWKTRKISLFGIWVMIGVGVACVTIAAATNVPAFVAKTFQRDVLDKDKSLSYKERTGWNTSAMETAKETYFVGAGLGSVRCSSLLYGLFANLGILGSILFAASFFAQFTPILSRGLIDPDDNLYGKSLLAAFIFLAAMSVSGSELAYPSLWSLFAAGVVGPSSSLARTDQSPLHPLQPSLAGGRQFAV